MNHRLARAFYESFERRDFAALRALLHDDLDFESPSFRCTDADGFVARLAKLSRLTESLHMRHLFIDGDRACCVSVWRTHTPMGDSPVAWYMEIRDDRIARICAHHDARPWAALFGRGAA